MRTSVLLFDEPLPPTENDVMLRLVVRVAFAPDVPGPCEAGEVSSVSPVPVIACPVVLSVPLSVRFGENSGVL
jgi:hypothetical protein